MHSNLAVSVFCGFTQWWLGWKCWKRSIHTWVSHLCFSSELLYVRYLPSYVYFYCRFSYNVVHFALRYIYCGESDIPDNVNIIEIATLADYLCLEGLKEIVSSTLKTKYCHFFHKVRNYHYTLFDGLLCCVPSESILIYCYSPATFAQLVSSNVCLLLLITDWTICTVKVYVGLLNIMCVCGVQKRFHHYHGNW